MKNYTTLFREWTIDRGVPVKHLSRDTWNEYIITSARLKDKVNDFIRQRGVTPTAQWFRRHAEWTKERIYY